MSTLIALQSMFLINEFVEFIVVKLVSLIAKVVNEVLFPPEKIPVTVRFFIVIFPHTSTVLETLTYEASKLIVLKSLNFSLLILKSNISALIVISDLLLILTPLIFV